MRVSVIGGSTVTDQEYDLAERVGSILAERGHTVVCGGLTGAMEAVCKGASMTGGRPLESSQVRTRPPPTSTSTSRWQRGLAAPGTRSSR